MQWCINGYTTSQKRSSLMEERKLWTAKRIASKNGIIVQALLFFNELQKQIHIIFDLLSYIYICVIHMRNAVGLNPKLWSQSKLQHTTMLVPLKNM